MFMGRSSRCFLFLHFYMPIDLEILSHHFSITLDNRSFICMASLGMTPERQLCVANHVIRITFAILLTLITFTLYKTPSCLKRKMGFMLV